MFGEMERLPASSPARPTRSGAEVRKLYPTFDVSDLMQLTALNVNVAVVTLVPWS